MNWKNKKTTSVYDLFKEENPDSGDILNKNFFQETQKDSVKYKKLLNHFPSENEKLIELRTKPSKSLIFSQSLNSINLKLYNDNSFPIIFKLKTTQPDILASQPARGFIQANSFLECHLTPIEIKYRLFLVIQYAQISNESEDYLTQWKSLKSENIFLKNFHCIFQDKIQIERKQTLVKPILFTFATVTLLTTLIYFRNK